MPCSDGDVRLVDGVLKNEGRVEICYQNQWGTLCHNNWDDTDAGVVCTQLGYSSLGINIIYSRNLLFLIQDYKINRCSLIFKFKIWEWERSNSS